MKRTLARLAVGWVIAAQLLGRTADIRVPADQPTIQAGIDAASPGDRVVVADGTYTGVGNTMLDFKGKAIRVEAANSGSGQCIIDCQVITAALNLSKNETDASVFSGFLVDNQGKPSKLNYSSPAILNCHFRLARYGALVGNYSSPVIRDCHFEACANYTSWNGFVNSAEGGAIALSDDASGKSITITGCTFTLNHATMGGGALAIDSPRSQVILRDCTFLRNYCDGSLPSLPYGGGAIDLKSASALIERCRFERNQALGTYYDTRARKLWYSNGSAIVFNYGDGERLSLTSCIFKDNEASERGAVAFYLFQSDDTASVDAVNCLFVNNVSKRYDPGAIFVHGELTVNFCTFSGNKALMSPSSRDGAIGVYGHASIQNSVFWGPDQTDNVSSDEDGRATGYVHNCVLHNIDRWTIASASKILTQDPLFLSTTNFHLQAASPCKGLAAPGTVETDLEGTPRSAATELGAYALLDTTPPTITKWSGSVTADLGATVILSVEASGAKPLTYLWIKDGRLLVSSTNSVYTINSLQATDVGTYKVVVTNLFGRVDGPEAVVAVHQPDPPPRVSTESLSRLPDGRFMFELTSPLNAVVLIQERTNLTTGAWQTLKTITNANGSTWFVDSEKQHRQRFYRLQQSP